MLRNESCAHRSQIARRCRFAALGIWVFRYIVRAVCAVPCRGVCALMRGASRSRCSWVRNDGKVRRSQTLAVQMRHTVPAMKSFATGIGPEKAIVSEEPDVVSRAPAMGTSVTPYTFRASAVTGYPNVQGEVAQFIESLRRRRRDHRQSGQGAAPLSSASGRRKASRERMRLTTVQDSNTRTRDFCRSLRNRADVVQLGHKCKAPMEP